MTKWQKDLTQFGYLILGLCVFCSIIIGLDAIVFSSKNNNEYVIEKHDDAKGNCSNVIHNFECPRYERDGLFSFRHSKYDFMLDNNTYFCEICFDDNEIYKMLTISRLNIKNKIMHEVEKNQNINVDSIKSMYYLPSEINDIKW